MSDLSPQDLPLGHRIAEAIARFVASSPAQLSFVLLYAAWFTFHWDLNWLMTILAIISLTLTQMVLKRQLAIEQDTRRRDLALHAKLDELILAKHGARDEMAGIEELAAEEIAELRDHAEEAISDAEDGQ